MSKEILQHMEEERLYPPRYIIKISSANAQRSDTLVLQFRGSLEAFEAEVLLELKHSPQPLVSQSICIHARAILDVNFIYRSPPVPCVPLLDNHY